MTITDTERRKMIQSALGEAKQHPPDVMREKKKYKLGNEDRLCWIVPMPVDTVLLNPNSHRLKSQLESDEEWQSLKSDPFSDEAQVRIAYWVRQARTPADFQALQKSLEVDGQTEEGVMTSDGVLINANTRVVAMRDSSYRGDRWINVAVLPTGHSDNPTELSLLELRLQLKKELKVPYSFTNELCFIEEMKDKHHLAPADIAREMGLASAAEVDARMHYLDLIRQMALIPRPPLPLPFFDEVALEQMKLTYARHQELLDSGQPEDAVRYLRQWLVAVNVKLSSVHNLREINEDFLDTYVLPNLEHEEETGKLLAKVIREGEPTSGSTTSDDSGLLTVDGDEPHQGQPDWTQRLVDVVFSKDNRVEIPGTDFVFERDTVTATIRDAMSDGIGESKSDKRANNQLGLPVHKLKEARKYTGAVIGAVERIADSPDFTNAVRSKITYEFKHLRKAVDRLEKELKANGVNSK